MGGDDSQGKSHWMYYFYCTCFYLHCSAPSEEDMLPHTKIELKSNGTVVPVANYLKNNLNDPNSYQPIEWSRIIETDKGVYSVRHRYRAKNAFNALIVCDQVFSMDSLGNIINVQNYTK